MQTLQNTLYQISNALLIPTLVILLVLTAWTVLMAGGLIREWLGRRALVSQFAKLRRLLKGGVESTAILDELRAFRSGLPARFAREIDGSFENPAEREKCLQDLESDVAVALSRLTWLTRTAPMLGLMGTLIPLGPALTGLASGDISMLSGNLVVAFTATVIGVLIGCIAYSMNIVRRNWYDRDMGDLEYILSKLDQPSVSR